SAAPRVRSASITSRWPGRKLGKPKRSRSRAAGSKSSGGTTRLLGQPGQHARVVEAEDLAGQPRSAGVGAGQPGDGAGGLLGVLEQAVALEAVEQLHLLEVGGGADARLHLGVHQAG